MTYQNFQFIAPLVFERKSPSGAITRFMVVPNGENRTALIFTLEVLFEEAPRYMRNDWQVTSCDSEAEFVSRFGQALYDLIIAEYSKVDDKRAAKHELGVKLAAIMNDIPAAIAGELEGDADMSSPDAIWKAKYAFIQNLHRLNNIKDHMYGLMEAEEAKAYYQKEVESEFNAFLVVNTEYVRRIVEALKPQYEACSHNMMMQVTIEVAAMTENPDAATPRRHDRAHHVAGVKVFLNMLETFLDRAKIVLEEESLGNISALMVAHTMCHEAIRGFKLFEQG